MLFHSFGKRRRQTLFETSLLTEVPRSKNTDLLSRIKGINHNTAARTSAPVVRLFGAGKQRNADKADGISWGQGSRKETVEYVQTRDGR